MKPILIVGAGFAGSVYARALAEAGHRVQVIDRRAHIGGNAYDHVDENGIRVHQYGPHIFHTRNRRVLDWVSRFGTFVPYAHKVRALLPNGRFAPLPINLDTVNLVFGTRLETAAEVAVHLKSVAEPIENPVNAAEYLHGQIGRELTSLFFRPYTKKMWALDLEEMSPSVVKRIPLRMDRSDGYYPDGDIVVMPRDGYTALFENILAHPNIEVALNVAFAPVMLRDAEFCFTAMAIDEYFDFIFGELPYRSIRFHSGTATPEPARGWSVTNFTGDDPFTRQTAWHEFPHHVVRDNGLRTHTLEEPCDYRDNNRERYYPIRTSDSRYQAIYERYRDLAARDKKVRFIGRCGTYQYLDMDQVINQSLAGAAAWLGMWSATNLALAL